MEGHRRGVAGRQVLVIERSSLTHPFAPSSFLDPPPIRFPPKKNHHHTISLLRDSTSRTPFVPDLPRDLWIFWDPGRGHDGSPPTLLSSPHCQSGTGSRIPPDAVSVVQPLHCSLTPPAHRPPPPPPPMPRSAKWYSAAKRVTVEGRGFLQAESTLREVGGGSRFCLVHPTACVSASC